MKVGRFQWKAVKEDARWHPRLPDDLRKFLSTGPYWSHDKLIVGTKNKKVWQHIEAFAEQNFELRAKRAAIYRETWGENASAKRAEVAAIEQQLVDLNELTYQLVSKELRALLDNKLASFEHQKALNVDASTLAFYRKSLGLDKVPYNYIPTSLFQLKQAQLDLKWELQTRAERRFS